MKPGGATQQTTEWKQFKSKWWKSSQNATLSNRVVYKGLRARATTRSRPGKLLLVPAAWSDLNWRTEAGDERDHFECKNRFLSLICLPLLSSSEDQCESGFSTGISSIFPVASRSADSKCGPQARICKSVTEPLLARLERNINKSLVDQSSSIVLSRAGLVPPGFLKFICGNGRAHINRK
ncbi:hypothetical protein CEXT_503181 [Caerostris extrusa]|uniref:Uncharacterized protein n=1 Tax=Caerostris extrusa TaxID=172846 RepID=A0AAV4P0P4_CAEEX|nr:hypothetical protein CEXT_503181 [Caerostris extrusa]